MKIAKTKIKNFKRIAILLLYLLFFTIAVIFVISYFAEEEIKKELIDESIDPEEELMREMEENP